MYARIETVEDFEVLGDAELIHCFRRGQDEALDVLLRRHSEALYRFCCHLMQTREDAEDICQETVVKAITRVDSLQAGSAFRSWLFSIARNLSVDSYRSNKRTCPMPDEEAMPLPLYGETPQDRIEISEEHQTVAEALGKLTQSHQTVLTLREVDGLSYADIASEMKVSQSAVETLLFRARRRLREEYGKSAVPVVAFLGSLRDLAARVAGPLIGGPVVAKVALTTAMVGSVIVADPQAVLPLRHAQQLTLPAPSKRVAHHPVSTAPLAAIVATMPMSRPLAVRPVFSVSMSSSSAMTVPRGITSPAPATKPARSASVSSQAPAPPVTHSASPRVTVRQPFGQPVPASVPIRPFGDSTTAPASTGSQSSVASTAHNITQPPSSPAGSPGTAGGQTTHTGTYFGAPSSPTTSRPASSPHSTQPGPGNGHTSSPPPTAQTGSETGGSFGRPLPPQNGAPRQGH